MKLTWLFETVFLNVCLIVFFYSSHLTECRRNSNELLSKIKQSRAQTKNDPQAAKILQMLKLKRQQSAAQQPAATRQQPQQRQGEPKRQRNQKQQNSGQKSVRINKKPSESAVKLSTNRQQLGPQQNRMNGNNRRFSNQHAQAAHPLASHVSHATTNQGRFSNYHPRSPSGVPMPTYSNSNHFGQTQSFQGAAGAGKRKFIPKFDLEPEGGEVEEEDTYLDEDEYSENVEEEDNYGDESTDVDQHGDHTEHDEAFYSLMKQFETVLKRKSETEAIRSGTNQTKSKQKEHMEKMLNFMNDLNKSIEEDRRRTATSTTTTTTTTPRPRARSQVKLADRSKTGGRLNRLSAESSAASNSTAAPVTTSAPSSGSTEQLVNLRL